MRENHFALRFSMNTPEDPESVTDQLPALMPSLFAAAMPSQPKGTSSGVTLSLGREEIIIEMSQ